jgi:hypothetical protein
MFDMERVTKLMQMGNLDVCTYPDPDYLTQVIRLYVEPVVQTFYQAFHHIFVAEPSATVYDVVRVILSWIFMVYVIFRGTLMSEKKIDILMRGINYLFFSFIWPIFLVYFLFAAILPSPTYSVW